MHCKERLGLVFTSALIGMRNGVHFLLFYFSIYLFIVTRCPPCRGFTPVLAEFYEVLAEEDRSALEIVFVSSDKDQSSFNGYYGEMPWSSVPFSNRTVAQV